MCLSTVFELGEGNTRTKLAEYVARLDINGNKISFSDIMGSEQTVTGTLQSIDLLKNIIVIAGREEISRSAAAQSAPRAA